MNLNVRLRPGLLVYLTGEWNSLKLAEGAFSTRLYPASSAKRSSARSSRSSTTCNATRRAPCSAGNHASVGS